MHQFLALKLTITSIITVITTRKEKEIVINVGPKGQNQITEEGCDMKVTQNNKMTGVG